MTTRAGVPQSISMVSKVSAKKAKDPQPCQKFRKMRSGFVKHIRTTACKECLAFAVYLLRKESITRYLTAHRNSRSRQELSVKKKTYRARLCTWSFAMIFTQLSNIR